MATVQCTDGRSGRASDSPLVSLVNDVADIPGMCLKQHQLPSLPSARQADSQKNGRQKVVGSEDGLS